MEPGSIQPGDVILFSGRSWVSRGIKAFTKSKYSHAALAVSGTFIIEATGAGVEKNELAPLLKNCDGYCIRRIPNLTVEQVELMKAKAYSLIYEDYDYLQLLSLGVYYAFRRIGIIWSWFVRNSENHMLCSELVAVAMLCIPLKLMNKAKLVTPGILYATDELVTIYEEQCK